MGNNIKRQQDDLLFLDLLGLGSDMSSEETLIVDKTKIHPDAPQYEEYIKSQALGIIGFAEEELNFIDTFSFLSEVSSYQEMVDRNKKKIRQKWKKLAEITRGDLKRKFIQQLIATRDLEKIGKVFLPLNDPRVRLMQRVLEDPAVHSWFQSQEKFRECSNAQELASFLFNQGEHMDSIPAEILLRMTKLNAEEVKSKSKEFQEKLPELLQIAKQKFLDAIVQQKIGVKVEKLERILQRLRVVAGDPLAVKLDRYSGKYIEDSGVIIVNPQLSQAEMLNTLIHEIRHAVSGRVVLKISSKQFDKDAMQISRLGLAFSEHFQWLDEAVVEKDTLIIAGLKDEEGTYSPERDLLELLTKDIDYTLFQDAQLEDLDPDIPADQRIPAWKKLQEALRNKFGSYFLVRLNKYIEANIDPTKGIESGLRTAIEAFNERRENFPQYLEEWNKSFGKA